MYNEVKLALRKTWPSFCRTAIDSARRSIVIRLYLFLLEERHFRMMPDKTHYRVNRKVKWEKL
jgi:hypothetical protein